MIKPIQDNDHYKPHAKNYSNLSMFTRMGFYMEIFEARVLWENLYLHQRFSVQSGVLPVYYSDDDHAAIYSILQ
jgi:hypothetical protein